MVTIEEKKKDKEQDETITIKQEHGKEQCKEQCKEQGKEQGKSTVPTPPASITITPSSYVSSPPPPSRPAIRRRKKTANKGIHYAAALINK
jgi:hypothetical protein